MLPKCQDLSSDPQHLHKKLGVAACVHVISGEQGREWQRTPDVLFWPPCIHHAYLHNTQREDGGGMEGGREEGRGMVRGRGREGKERKEVGEEEKEGGELKR